MVELYITRGMTEIDAKDVITKMSNYPSFFVDVMMAEELGLLPPVAASHRSLFAGVAYFLGSFLPIALSASCALAFSSHEAGFQMILATSCVSMLTYVGRRKALHCQVPQKGLMVKHFILGLACSLVPHIISKLWHRSF